MGITPDKIILMGVKHQTTSMRIKNNLLSANSPLYGPELDEVAEKAIEEYKLHIAGLKKAFAGFVYEYDAIDKDQNEVANDLARMLRIRYKNDAPRRPPRVILLGPPGSGRSTQAHIIGKRFGLVCIQTGTLLREEVKKSPTLALIISKCIHEGKMVPDEIVIPLIEKRLKESDCKVNGWVMEGFP